MQYSNYIPKDTTQNQQLGASFYYQQPICFFLMHFLANTKQPKGNTIASLSKKIGYISDNTFFVTDKKHCGISPHKNR
tara:strand:- start:129 stop:362 length:234 start_codon:yes stop_codon:yes gene_type:complete